MLKSKEVLLLQDVWRQAYRKGTLDLEFQTKAGATRARLQLYNAVRKQKAGEDMDDLELVHAAEQLEIVWNGETSIRLQKRADNDMMTGIAKALGKNLEDYVDPEALASSEKLLGELEALGVQQRATTQAPTTMVTVVPPGALDSGLAPDHQDNPFYGKRS
jgi:hypothetical protein